MLLVMWAVAPVGGFAWVDLRAPADPSSGTTRLPQCQDQRLDAQDVFGDQ
jgi:hypothetical protein